MHRLTSIVFDLDGTLYVSDELAKEISAVAADGLAIQLALPPEVTTSRLAAAKEQLFAKTGCEATLSAACELLDCDLKQLHRYLEENVSPEKHLTRDDRVVAMLERLARHYRLYIYTNNNRPLAMRIISATGLDGLFADIFSVEDFWRAKPDRLALARIYAAIGAEPVECLFAGDRHDIDLKLPEEHGSRVFLTTSITELLSMEEWLKKGE